MRLVGLLKPLAGVALVGGLGALAYSTRDRWIGHFVKHEAAAAPDGEAAPVAPAKIIVNEQAQANLGLTAKAVKPQTYWKTIAVPGMVVDRPGFSDRSVVAPAAGVVTRIAHVPGDTVRPGAVLFTLKLLSESLFQTQTELFKATEDIKLARAERARLVTLKDTVAGNRVIEKDADILRLQVAVKAHRQDLLNRGFAAELVEGIAEGKFVNEIAVHVPTPPKPPEKDAPSLAAPDPPPEFEVQELKVEAGQQVQAGQTLCTLANHNLLAVEGRAFRDETPLLERSVRERWPVEVDFQEDPAAGWGELGQSFRIRHLANTIDPVNRTFAFTMPLENQSHAVEADGRTQKLWRFRPGQQVRLMVRVEEVKNVLVLPADAVTRDGPEAFAFTQNVNTFERVPVRVLLQDRQQVVVANDGALPPGTYVAQGGAAQLNRMLKAGGASGVPKGYHMHADGSLHKNEDEGK